MLELSLADQVCLAVVGEQPTHGWTLVKLLAPDGELGRIWSLNRALVYRSIVRLVDAGLVGRTDVGRRSQLRITRRGTRVRDDWLDRPVEHLRDLRTEFLLKLELRARAERSNDELVGAQIRCLAPAIAALTETRPVNAVEMWRQESADAARRFLERLAAPSLPP